MGDKLRNLRSGQSIDISGLILAEKRKGLVEKLFLVFSFCSYFHVSLCYRNSLLFDFSYNQFPTYYIMA